MCVDGRVGVRVCMCMCVCVRADMCLQLPSNQGVYEGVMGKQILQDINWVHLTMHLMYQN